MKWIRNEDGAIELRVRDDKGVEQLFGAIVLRGTARVMQPRPTKHEAMHRLIDAIENAQHDA